MPAKVVGKVEVPVKVESPEEEKKVRVEKEKQLAWANREGKVPVKTDSLFEEIKKEEPSKENFDE
jgi:hypothetical protein